MRITALGTGNFFTTGDDNWHSNFLIEAPNGHTLLLDAGSDIRHALADQGKTDEDIDAIFISHLHSDHCGGVEWFAFASYFKRQADARPEMFISHDLADKLWNQTLSASLVNIPVPGAVSLETYFDTHIIGEDRRFIWQGNEFELVPVEHVRTENEGWFPTYGLDFTVRGGKRLFFTCDTTFTPEKLMDRFEAADIIMHDCEFSEKRSGVHANYADLKTLPVEIRAKMWLYHYQPGPRPDAVAEGFAGWLEKGQTLPDVTTD